jgi:SAM-dependent methyltransferase
MRGKRQGRQQNSAQTTYDESALRAAFDRAAETIDATVLTNPVNAWLRRESRRELLAAFPTGSTLLEIGCGTGADAIFLAERDRRVAALDISDRMIERARENVAARKLERSVLMLRGRLDEVANELGRSDWWPFDGAYANFSLAYEESLPEVARIVHSLLKPGARFVFSVPNKLCLFEPAAAFVRLRFGRILRRLHEPLWVTVHDMTVRVRVYSPARIRGITNGLFSIEGLAGMPVFMPPPSLYRPSFDWLRASFESFDNRLARRFPWQLLGDSILFTTRKVGP